MTVGQVIRRIRELDETIKNLETEGAEVFCPDIAEYLKDYQRMLLQAEAKV